MSRRTAPGWDAVVALLAVATCLAGLGLGVCFFLPLIDDHGGESPFEILIDEADLGVAALLGGPTVLGMFVVLMSALVLARRDPRLPIPRIWSLVFLGLLVADASAWFWFLHENTEEWVLMVGSGCQSALLAVALLLIIFGNRWATPWGLSALAASGFILIYAWFAMEEGVHPGGVAITACLLGVIASGAWLFVAVESIPDEPEPGAHFEEAPSAPPAPPQ